MTEVQRLTEFSKNEDWFYQQRESLRSTYPNKYVMISGQKVLYSADDLDEINAHMEGLDETVRETAAIEFIAENASCMLL